MTRLDQPDLFAVDVAEASARMVAPTRIPSPLLDGRPLAVQALDEAESLAMLVTRALPDQVDPATVADALLARFGDIGHVLGAPQPELAQVAGAEVAVELTWLHALLVRSLQFPLRRREVLTSWDAVSTYLRARLRALPREVFHVLFLDTKNQLIADECMGEGTVNHAPVYPREVVRRALELSARARTSPQSPLRGSRTVAGGHRDDQAGGRSGQGPGDPGSRPHHHRSRVCV